MAFRPLISRSNAKGLAVAGLCLLVIYPLFIMLIDESWPLGGIVTFVALLLGCGAVVGYLAPRSLMRGLVLGALVGTIAIVGVAGISGLGARDIGSIFKPDFPALVSIAVPGITLSWLGFVLGNYLREGRRAP